MELVIYEKNLFELMNKLLCTSDSDNVFDGIPVNRVTLFFDFFKKKINVDKMYHNI